MVQLRRTGGRVLSTFDPDYELNATPDAQNRAQVAAQVWHRAYGWAVVVGLCTLFGLRAAILILSPPGPEPSFTPQLTGAAATSAYVLMLVITLARHHGFAGWKLATVVTATLMSTVMYELGWIHIPPRLGLNVGLWWPNLAAVFLTPIAFEMWHVRKSGVPHLLYSAGDPSPEFKKPWHIVVFWLLIMAGVFTLWIMIRQGVN